MELGRAVGGRAACSPARDPVNDSNCSLRTASKRGIFLNEGPDRGVYTGKGQHRHDWGVHECADCES